ncbi:hypothetical protein WA026_006185 [Henosepilachna vigintioctopunctata]|uniref:Uncharacterized protein n=1 Tax=Henosepilachna vigintioctopunctata TaxID=420089 RepID=A0AAW1TQN6_9CUCU
MLTYLFVSIFIISFAKGDFNYKFKYCRIRCGCSYSEEKSKDSEPSDYYWRDFYGIIPPDAFPIGDENQYPQTYVGLVFDPLNNGTFVTTIADGLDYVYNANDGKVFQKTKLIQILCTTEADRLAWVTLTSGNASSVTAEYSFVRAGYHQRKNANDLRYVPTYFVVKISKCKIAYARSTISLGEKLEFAAMDGTLQKSDQKMFLMYKKNKTEREGKKNKPFISHIYKYSIRGGSIIPNFYKQLNIGSCSLTCTNDAQDNNSKDENSIKSANAMEYYWKPRKLIKQDEPIVVENNTVKGSGAYVGQGFISLNWLDVGETTGVSVLIGTNNGGVSQSTDVHILCSNHQEKFEWVNTTSDRFAELDRSRMIPGGELDNGTTTVVGRELIYKWRAASVRIFGQKAYSYSIFGASNDYSVLLLNN